MLDLKGKVISGEGINLDSLALTPKVVDIPKHEAKNNKLKLEASARRYLNKILDFAGETISDNGLNKNDIMHYPNVAKPVLMLKEKGEHEAVAIMKLGYICANNDDYSKQVKKELVAKIVPVLQLTKDELNELGKQLFKSEDLVDGVKRNEGWQEVMSKDMWSETYITIREENYGGREDVSRLIVSHVDPAKLALRNLDIIVGRLNELEISGSVEDIRKFLSQK